MQGVESVTQGEVRFLAGAAASSENPVLLVNEAIKAMETLRELSGLEQVLSYKEILLRVVFYLGIKHSHRVLRSVSSSINTAFYALDEFNFPLMVKSPAQVAGFSGFPPQYFFRPVPGVDYSSSPLQAIQLGYHPDGYATAFQPQNYARSVEANMAYYTLPSQHRQDSRGYELSAADYRNGPSFASSSNSSVHPGVSLNPLPHHDPDDVDMGDSLTSPQKSRHMPGSSSAIHPGFVNDRGEKVHFIYSDFFGQNIDVYTAESDPSRTLLYRASALRKKTGLPANKLAMFLARKRSKFRDQIYQASSFTYKLQGVSGCKIGGYFISIKICKMFESAYHELIEKRARSQEPQIVTNQTQFSVPPSMPYSTYQ